MSGFAQGVKLAYYPIAQVPGRNGVEVDLGTAFESSERRNT